MLLIPTIIFTLSGISGAGGIALSVKSIADSMQASATNRFVQEQNERNILRFEACSQKLDHALSELGKQRMVIAKNFSVFINAFEKIHNRPEFSQNQDIEFPSFDFADAALETGGTLPGVMSAANDIAVERFLKEEIPFGGIWKIIEKVMSAHVPEKQSSLEQIMAVDKEARIKAREVRI